MITNDPKELEYLRRSGKILAQTLALVARHVVPGVAALELDKIAEDNIRKMGGVPSFKNYRSHKNDPPFPASLCVSVNDEVVHGIPTQEKILKEGDIVGLDLGVNYQGYFTDAAITVPVGRVSQVAQKLITTTKKALQSALAEIQPGKTTGDIGFATEAEVKNANFSVVRELVGHGVGKSVHEEPEIPCFGKRGTGSRLVKGMVIAVEPMVNEKSWEVAFAEDKWTILTLDGSLSAHFEHTVIVTDDGYEILTQV